MSRMPAWSASELQQLRVHYASMPWSGLTSMLARTKAAIALKARSIGLCRGDGMPNLWSADEIKTMHEKYPTTSARELAMLLGRPETAVLKKAQNLGIKKVVRIKTTTSGRTRSWTPADDDRLRSVYKSMSIAKIALDFGRSEISVRLRAHRLKLTRPNDRKRRPIGTERIHRRELERKVANTGVRRLDWKRVIVIEWEAINGPVPDGMLLVPRQGKKKTVENLVLVAPGDYPLAAARHNLPAEMRKIMDIKAQIGRALSRIEKENHQAAASSRNRCQWTQAEIAYLTANYGIQSYKEIAATLNRSLRAIQKRRQALGLKVVDDALPK